VAQISQIEPAKPYKYLDFTYLDYEGHYGLTGVDAYSPYLTRTAYWVDKYKEPVSPTLTMTPTPTQPSPTLSHLPEDIDRDECVGILDFNAWFQAMRGNPRPGTFPDINGDGSVDIVDFNLWFRAMKNLPPEKLC